MTQQKPSRIPSFATHEEEAAFWDVHDFTDFLDELQEVEVKFADNLSESLTIRLTPAMMAQLRALANVKGVSTSTLVRVWVAEHLAFQSRL